MLAEVLTQQMQDNLLPARLQMAMTLGFHIVLACLGVGLPVLMLAAEWRFLRTGDELWRTLARRWSKSFAVLFAVGAVSGTVLSFELGLLWPEFMGRWGGVIGMPFTLEGFAFFIEAIFAGIYLYSWDRLPPKAHWLSGWPVAVSGLLSAAFVTTANSWMNTPTGFRLENGAISDIDPVAAILNPASAAQVTHMLVAAYVVTGFLIAGFYAVGVMRGSREYDRRAFALALSLCLPLVPVQMAVGDWSAKVVAATQPVKLAAMEGQFRTERNAPLRIGGWPDEERRETPYAIEIPGALSFLSYSDANAEVKGLDSFPRDEQPPVAVVHMAFQVMVGVGGLMMVAALWALVVVLRTRSLPDSGWFCRTMVCLGPLSVIALEAGWIVTEVGRQPWIVHGYMRTASAVTGSPGLWSVFGVTLVVYAVIGVSVVVVLRQLSRVPLESGDGS